MACGRRCAVAASVTVVLLAIVLYAPTPETDDDLQVPSAPNTALAEPFTVWLAKSLRRASVRLATWGEALGLVDYIATRRQMKNALYRGFAQESDTSDLETEETNFDGVTVKIYKPNMPTNGEKGIGIIYFHGGNFFQGSIGTHEHVTVALAKRLRGVVVSVQYALSPENPFPNALHDCVAATKYFIAHAADLQVDQNRVAVAGDGAGGNLAAAVAIMIKSDAFQPKPKLQVLIQPLLQAVDLELPSHQMRTTSGLNTRTEVAMAAMLYAGKSPSFAREYAAAVIARNHTSIRTKEESLSFLDLGLLPYQFLAEYEPKPLNEGDSFVLGELEEFVMNPLAFPLVSSNSDLEDLPFAVIVTAEYDVLRDDGIIYAQRLETAGVHTKWIHIENGFHGMVQYLGLQSGVSLLEKLVISIRDQL